MVLLPSGTFGDKCGTDTTSLHIKLRLLQIGFEVATLAMERLMKNSKNRRSIVKVEGA